MQVCLSAAVRDLEAIGYRYTAVSVRCFGRNGSQIVKAGTVHAFLNNETRDVGFHFCLPGNQNTFIIF